MIPDHLAGLVRRIRRQADLSQRQLAAACGISQSAVARVETGRGDLSAKVLLRAADLAGLRVALLDEDGQEVRGMSGDAVRDAAGRRYPAHLDIRHGDDGWWYPVHRYGRPTPWYTFDRARWLRDGRRRRDGTPEDHLPPDPDDDPWVRVARRQAEARARQAAERERRHVELVRRVAAGEARWPEDWTCGCPPGCDPTREVVREVHVDDCPCRCDLA